MRKSRMTPRTAREILETAFAALPRADRLRLRHHAIAGTPILCGTNASHYQVGEAG